MEASRACACAVITARLTQGVVPVINTGAAVGAREVSLLISVKVVLVADRTFFACRGVREAYDGFAEEFGEEFVNDAGVAANETVGTFKTHDLLLLAIVVVVGEIVV